MVRVSSRKMGNKSIGVYVKPTTFGQAPIEYLNNMYIPIVIPLIRPYKPATFETQVYQITPIDKIPKFVAPIVLNTITTKFSKALRT